MYCLRPNISIASRFAAYQHHGYGIQGTRSLASKSPSSSKKTSNKIVPPRPSGLLSGASATVSLKAPPKSSFSSVYIHPLSQLVLQCLQKYHHSWINSHALDRIRLHNDGTFVFGNDTVRVWTYSDKDELEHWLAVMVGDQQTGFLLQDNTGRQQRYKKAGSAPERVEESVHLLVKSINKLKV